MADNKTPFIDRNTARDAFDESNKWLRPYFEPIEELERIARNKPSPKIDPALPKITDGTMAAIIQEQPKRIIQQAPTGLVEAKGHEEYSKLGDIVLHKELIPMYNRQGDILQKGWNIVGKAMTWGRSTSYTFYTSTGGKMHTDFVIPYVKDIITEKGKVYAPDSNIQFMRSWYGKRDLKGILQWEQKLEKKDKNYKSDWDLKLLADLIEGSTSSKPADLQTPAEKERGGGDAGGFEVIHAFQTGVGAEIYSFSPHFEDGRPLRVKINRDPRGKIPLDHMYCNIDLSNPLGRGQVELSGGIQNLMDQQMQMFQFMSTVEMDPPKKIRGNLNPAKLKMRPGAAWLMGNGGQNDVEPYAVSNFALQNFGANYGLMKSTILGLNSSQDSSISAESGSPTQSKTQAGVEAQQARLGVSDNYLRKQYEKFHEDQSETSLNIYFSEMRGNADIKLDKADRLELEKTKSAEFINEEGNLTVPYSKIKDVVLNFTVNSGTSEVKEDSENVDKLSQSLELATKVPDPKVQEKVYDIFKLLVKEIGAEGVDEIFPEDQTDENGQPVEQQPEQPQMTPEMVQQMVMETVGQAMEEMKAQEKPQEDPTLALIKALGLKYDQLPPQARQIVLASTGFGSADDDNDDMAGDPVQTKHDLEKLSALNQADAHEREPEQRREEREFSQSQSQSKTTPQQKAAPVAPSEEMPDMSAEPSEEEQAVIEALAQRGFSEDDIEQAVVMLRQGSPLEEVIPTIGAKYGG